MIVIRLMANSEEIELIIYRKQLGEMTPRRRRADNCEESAVGLIRHCFPLQMVQSECKRDAKAGEKAEFLQRYYQCRLVDTPEFAELR